MRYIVTFFGIIFFALGFASTYMDVVESDQPWHVIGQVWFQWAPTSLQITESVISRYIDPCGLFISLDCAPVLWHPIISTALNWYATPVFLILGFALMVLGRWLGKRKGKKAAKAAA